MDENRGAPRQRALKGGKITYGGGSIVIDCTIRNLSASGARLQVPTSVAIPEPVRIFRDVHRQAP
jgi:hypothetical protein